MANTTATAENKKSFVSINRFEVSGRIVKEPQVYNSEKHGTCVRFTLGHYMGKHRDGSYRDSLFTDIVMFSKNGSKPVEIPLDLLKHGNGVLVSGYRRANNLRKDGKIVKYGTDYVALEVTDLATVAESAEVDGTEIEGAEGENSEE